jgi:hypothetical protein
MTGPKRSGLAGPLRLSYNLAVTATLRSLDLYPMYVQTDARLRQFKELLADPLGYSPKSESPRCIAEAGVLPPDEKKHKYYLYFHADKDPGGRGGEPLISVHLRYRQRPRGPVPKETKDLKVRGLTSVWAEHTMRTLDPILVLVEAELTFPSKERQPSMKPAIRVGSSALKSCGEEYRAERMKIDALSTYRWSEDSGGTITVWLSYSRRSVEQKNGCWVDEEKRCREYLQQLA